MDLRPQAQSESAWVPPGFTGPMPSVPVDSHPRVGQRAISTLIEHFGQWLVPAVCLACHVPLGSHNALCGACWQKVSFIRPPLCDRLGIPLPYDTGDGISISAAAAAHPPVFARARAVAHYDGVMRQLIQGLKYSDRHDPRNLFGRWLQAAGASLLEDCDVIVPVPLGRWRLLSRRFNQAAIIAGEVARLAGKPHAPLALVRDRTIVSQVGLSRDQRERNVAGAFSVPLRRQAEVAGKRVLLIDDVITTGATAQACTRALRRAGATEVDVLAMALVTDKVRAAV